MNKSLNERDDQFHWWITCIPDKIIELKRKVPVEISVQMNYSIESLDILEGYTLNNYSLDELKNEKQFWDSLASYVGVVYEKNVKGSRWSIEIENEKDIFFNMPILKVENKFNFQPHSYVTAMLDRKKGNFLSTIVKKHMEGSNS